MNKKSSMTPTETWLSGFIFILVALVALPTFSKGLACSDDILPHLYRSVQFDLNVRHGRPFLQWGQELMRGYGYPIFAFYAPLSYILIELIHFLGPELGTIYQWGFWAVLPFAGWGAYRWGRRYFQPLGAFVTGVAYMFAPYLLYNTIQRGAFPESLAMALFPWAMFTADLLLDEQTPRAIIRAALTFSLLILAHNVVALFALPLAFLLALITVYQRSKTPHVSIYHGWALLKPTVLFLGLTLLLTAWFWLPIVVELPYTQSRLTEPYLADWPTPQNQILLASKLVAFPEIPADLDLLNPSRLRTMGVGQAILALIGLLIAWWHPTGSERRWQLITMGGVIACCLYAMTGASLWLWDLGLDTIQLPSRLLGPASLLAALLSGQAVNQLMIWGQTIFKAKWLPVFLWGSTAALLTAASGWPWLYHLYCPVTNQPSQFELVQITTWSRIIGAAQGELLPKWVQSYPPQDLLLNQYDPTAEYVLINRLELQSATADNAAVHLPIAPAHDRYQLNLDTPTTAVYHTFYFPGWQATLDGETLPLNIQEPHGLIKLELPAGQHQLEIFFGRTLIRQLTLWLSGLTLLATLLWGLLTQNRNRPPQTTSHAPPVRPASLRPLLLVAVTLIVVKFGLVEQFNNPIRATRLQDGQLSGVDVATQINFSNQFQHLGYEMSPPLTAGERFDFRQYWTPLANLGVPYQFDFRIADEDGRIWNGPNNRPYDYVFYPGPLNWQQGKYGLDAYVSQTLVGTPPGRYWLETTAFRRDVTFALTAENAPTAADPAWARLGQIEILSPPEQPLLTTENAAVQTIHQRPLPSQPLLTLYGSSLISFPPVKPYDEVIIELLWQGQSQFDTPQTAVLQLQQEEGQLLTEEELVIGGRYPTDQWPAEAVVRQQTAWPLPRNLASGRYIVLLEGIELGTVEVVAPDRQFTRPDIDQTAEATFGFAQLDGYTLSELTDEAPLTLTLLWQALDTTDTNYRVFVHLRDAAGQIVAQSDGEPAQWARPTRGWLTAEYIVDEHNLALPPDLAAGAYQIVVGLYNPATMARLGESTLTTIQKP